MYKKIIFTLFLSLFLFACTEEDKKYILHLDVTPTNGGFIEALPNKTEFSKNEIVELKTIESEGFVFKEWLGENQSDILNNELLMNSDKSITAVFEKILIPETYTLNISIEPEGAGIVLIDNNKATYDKDEELNLTIQADSSYSFLEWSGADKDSILSGNKIIMDSNKNLTAIFKLSADRFENFSEFFEAVKSEEVTNRASLVQEYFDMLRLKENFPLINGENVTFISKNDSEQIYLQGDFNYWGQKPVITMTKLEGTDLFYYETTFLLDARIEYEFFNSEGEYFNDPYNKYFGLTGWGKHSEVKMPNYPIQEEVLFYENILHGQVINDLEIECSAVVSGTTSKRNRPYQIYLPPNYDDNINYKVIYFQDGTDYSNLMEINNVLDYLISNNEIEPVIGVFLACIDRNEDYILEDKDVYLNFLVDIMIPFIDTNYSTDTSTEGRIISGLSNSGSFALYTAYKHPELFGYVLSQSGALNTLSYYGETLGNNFASADFPFRFYQVVGTYEGWHSINKSANSSFITNDSFKAYKYIETNQGHTIFTWRDTFAEGLSWLLSNDAGDDILASPDEIGDTIFSALDLEGDGYRNGSIIYPTNSSFAEDAFDLKSLTIKENGDNYLFNIKMKDNLSNPWGIISGWSIQNFDIYINTGTGKYKQTMLGKNIEITQGWDKAIFISPEKDFIQNVHDYITLNDSIGDSDSEKEDLSSDIILASNFQCYKDTIIITIPKSTFDNLELKGIQVLATAHDHYSENLIRSIEENASEWTFGGASGAVLDVPVLDILGDNIKLNDLQINDTLYYFPSIDLISI